MAGIIKLQGAYRGGRSNRGPLVRRPIVRRADGWVDCLYLLQMRYPADEVTVQNGIRGSRGRNHQSSIGVELAVCVSREPA